MKYKIKPEMIIAIMKADTSLNCNNKTVNNPGNVGNVDSGGTWTPDTLRQGIEAIYKTLNNKWLNYATKIGELSGGGRANLGLSDCRSNCYALSISNWNRNVKAVLSELTGQQVDENYQFRF